MNSTGKTKSESDFWARVRTAPASETRQAALKHGMPAAFASEERRVLAATVPVPERFRNAAAK